MGKCAIVVKVYFVGWNETMNVVGMFYLAFGLMAIADKRMEVCINIAKYCV
jgi:hypothetical protein